VYILLVITASNIYVCHSIWQLLIYMASRFPFSEPGNFRSTLRDMLFVTPNKKLESGTKRGLISSPLLSRVHTHLTLLFSIQFILCIIICWYNMLINYFHKRGICQISSPASKEGWWDSHVSFHADNNHVCNNVTKKFIFTPQHTSFPPCHFCIINICWIICENQNLPLLNHVYLCVLKL
jgi:hypothetical protein